MGTYQSEFRLVTVNSYPECVALELQFTTPVTYKAHSNAVAFTVLNPKNDGVLYIRMLITRERWTGVLSTRFESGYARELYLGRCA